PPTPTQTSTLSLPDALPICTAEWMWDTYDRLGPETDIPAARPSIAEARDSFYLARYATAFGDVEALRSPLQDPDWRWPSTPVRLDRKSTRLNSSHVKISYAV